MQQTNVSKITKINTKKSPFPAKSEKASSFKLTQITISKLFEKFWTASGELQ